VGAGSRLDVQADLRYTPTSGFATFPWPSPTTVSQRESVAAASVALMARRTEICHDREIGLTTLYNQVDDGAYQDLSALNRVLDEAVTACYVWPRKVAQDGGELVRRLLKLNAEIAAGDRPYVMATAREQRRVLVSADTDFGEILARSNDRQPSVVLYRGSEVIDAKVLGAILLTNLPQIEESLVEGSIVVLLDDRIRVRRLPLGADVAE
jgi:predicted nuclease of predicted toxin-antitoxin system